MGNKKLIIKSVVIALVVFTSCVPLKEFSELKDTSEKYRNSNQLLKEENEDLTVEKNELEGKYGQAYRKLVDLTDRVAKMEKELNDLKYKNEKLQQLKEDYEKQVNSLKQGSSEEISELLTELQKLQNDLQEREDRVREAEQQLKHKQEELSVAQQQLANQQQQLGDAEKELAEKEARLMELQDALDKQKNAVTQLKDKLYSALKGFYDQGLRVHEKNGKVYVSMDEKLLFKTGSYNLGPQGEQALAAIADILASNADVNVMIEGHTDDVPLNGTSQIKDNWDLSVMRATAVTKILLNNSSIDPKRIIAAGRSEYVPLESDKTPEARKKNRRTEIILTPDLGKILNILESN